MLRLTEAQTFRLKTFPFWTLVRENAKVISTLLAAVILMIPLGLVQYRLAAANGHIDRGLELHYKGRNEEAIQQFQQSLKTRPDYFGAYNDIGLCLENEGHHTQAIALYHQALAFAPNNSQVLSNLGLALFRHGDRATGLADLRAAVKANPDDARAHTMLGRSA